MYAIELMVDMISYDHISLRWNVTPAPAGPVQFEILRSGTPTTGFESVGLSETPLHIDFINMMSRFRPVFYRVRAVIEGQAFESQVAGIDMPPEHTLMVLAKRERFQLAKYDGNPAWLYVRRQWGVKCPVCTTPTHGPVTDSCTRCYNTGIEGGFFPPVPIYVSFKGLNQERGQHMPTHVDQQRSNQLWTANWAMASSDDVLIEAGAPFLVWNVDSVARSAYNRSFLSQTLVCNTVERGHVYYDLPRPTAFQWPDPVSEVWYESFTPGEPAFDDLWAQRLKIYLDSNPTTLHDQVLEVPEMPKPVSVDAGDYDPFAGGFR